jgi:4-methoxybenzoate monooxygenase (O-demethylating)
MTSAAPGHAVPVLDLDPYADDVLADPTAFHTSLREAGPVAWLSRYGVYAAGGYDEVRAGLSNPQDLVSSAGVGLTDLRRASTFRTPSLLIEADPPAHTARRVIMDSVLNARALRTLRDQVADAAIEVVDQALAAGTVDGITALAEALPLTVFPRLVGLSDSVRPHLLTYGDLVFNSGGPANAHLERALSNAGDAITAIAEQTRRENLTTDGIGARIWAAVDRGELPAEEAPLLIRSLLTAGVDTTVSAIAATLHYLAESPDQWEILRSDPRRARFAFEEAIRHDSPVQTFYRTAIRPVDLGGVTLQTDTKILLSLGAANHDPRRFPDPDHFDLNRAMSGHVGFGMGVHQCVGQHFGRLEGEALLTALVTRVRSLEPAGPPERRLNNTLRAWRKLPLRLAS